MSWIEDWIYELNWWLTIRLRPLYYLIRECLRLGRHEVRWGVTAYDVADVFNVVGRRRAYRIDPTPEAHIDSFGDKVESHLYTVFYYHPCPKDDVGEWAEWMKGGDDE